MKHMGTQKIETERLILRKFKLDDAEHMFKNWANDISVTKYLTWPPHDNIETTVKLLTLWIPLYKNNNYYQWCIELKETSQAIGSISAVNVFEETDTVEIGYCIGRQHWNKGFTSEALSAIIKFFFDMAGVNRVQANHDINNPNSGRVMARCGLKHEGTLIQAARNQQGLCDICVYGLVKRDYDLTCKNNKYML